MTRDVVVLEPVVSWPREVELGRHYLVTVDIRSAAGLESWPYDEEQFELSCVLDAQPYLDTDVVDDPVLVLHRFGGTYRPVRFVISARQLPRHDGSTNIWLSYVNRWGVLLRTVPLPLTVSSRRDVTAQPSDLVAQRAAQGMGAPADDGHVMEGQLVRLPPRPVLLAGREELLAELDARLSGGDGAGPRMVVLCGLGGAGKTSVAVEYAYRHLAEVGVVWQFPAEDPRRWRPGSASWPPH